MTKFTDNALTILNARYLRKDEEGRIIETPDQMLHRVAGALSDGQIEPERAYYEMMANLDFLPNTPTLINAGRKDGQLSACFVLPVEDSMDDIFTAIKNTALIHKTGGGTGFSFSKLRSKGSRISTTGGEASGVISFMKVFDAATESVKQGGVRRGANMGLLNIDHPDIEEFIVCKDDPTKFTNFNISIGITDKFMSAMRNDEEFDLIDPHTKKIVKTVKARDLWESIVYQAWKNGEPGLVFLDEINRNNPTPWLGDFEATNPCGEQPLLPYESCNLGSINLSNFVNAGGVDLPRLEDTVRLAVDFLNDVLDHNHFPLPEIKEKTLKTRKIGLGVMGFADALIKLGVAYSSPMAEWWAHSFMRAVSDAAWEYSHDHEYNNSTLTTIAPTGTISILANVSSGIEPNFSWVYKRNSCDTVMYVVHPLMEEALKNIGMYNDDILAKLGSGVPVKDIPELKSLGDYWELSQEIDPVAHIRIQAAFQQRTDNAVSKTINLPNSATILDVDDAYQIAYQMKCKGITVYRDGSRLGQVLSFDKRDETGAILEDVDAYTDDFSCDHCGAKLERAEGCVICYACGNGKCG